MFYVQNGPYQINGRKAYAITAIEVTGGGRVLPIWLEEFLGEVKLYVKLAGQSLLKIAAAIQGKGASLCDCLTAAAEAEGKRTQRPKTSLVSRLLNLNR
jgi:hypothetical protein